VVNLGVNNLRVLRWLVRSKKKGSTGGNQLVTVTRGVLLPLGMPLCRKRNIGL
jgi:hypothetical protein